MHIRKPEIGLPPGKGQEKPVYIIHDVGIPPSVKNVDLWERDVCLRLCNLRVGGPSLEISFPPKYLNAIVKLCRLWASTTGAKIYIALKRDKLYVDLKQNMKESFNFFGMKK